jgi:phosphoribosylamine--glycine ligase
MQKIDLIIIGPEKPLVEGIVDYLEKFNIKVFGPNKTAAELEGSKIFTKKICKKFNIPTANFGVFENEKEAKVFLNTAKYPTVIKADNLASGKGVYICKNKNEALIAIKEIFEGKFGFAKNILVEEFLQGEEMSFFTIHDGKIFKNFDTAQDHKRVLEGDKGKNTGGMGAYSPSRLITKDLEKKILNKIIKPTLLALKELGCEYKGFLYTGLMIVNNEPYLIEYNVRMGDPECQTILPKRKTELIDILIACCEHKLNKINIEWFDIKSLCVVLCSKGYPDTFHKNIEINNLNKIKFSENNFIFHAGTIMKNEKIYAIGGRVLNFVSISKDFNLAKKNIINNINNLNWHGGFYRKDIGYKVLK